MKMKNYWQLMASFQKDQKLQIKIDDDEKNMDFVNGNSNTNNFVKFVT